MDNKYSHCKGVGVQFLRSIQDDEDRVHVLPVNDMREHEEIAECWCEPRVIEDGSVVVHNSMDGRELVERHGLQ